MQYETINELYPSILRTILAGDEVSPRGQRTRELIGVRLELAQPAGNLLVSPKRALNYTFQVAEWLWILGGHNRLDLIQPYNSVMARFSDDGVHMTGAYGPKFADQLPYVLAKLNEDPMTRQAVMTFWRERPGQSKDVPCTISLQFLLRQRGLHLITTMRSNDAWLGLPYDIFTFTQLQRYVAMVLEVPVGSYIHQAGSLHLYEDKFQQAWDVIQEFGSTEWRPQSPALTPMPKAFRAMWEGLTLIAQQPDATSRDPQQKASEILSWVDQNAQAMPQPWADYLMLLAYRFVKSPHILSDLYKDLISGRT